MKIIINKDVILILIFMLPKINEKQGLRQIVPYHTFTRQIMRKRTSQNNINKLKMLKQFLDDQQYQGCLDRSECRSKISSQFKSRKSVEKDSLKPKKGSQEKENNTRSSKYRRKSLTAQTNSTHHKQKSLLYQKDRSIFAVPDRFKLNELLLGGGKQKKPIIKDILSNSIKMNNKLNTHRIL